MSKARYAGRDSLRRLPFYKLSDAGVIFCCEWARLSSPNRRRVEDILLKHAFSPNGTDSYQSPRWYINETKISYGMFKDISLEMAAAWSVWVREINKTCASRVACREAILGMVSNLVNRKSLVEQAHCMTTQVPRLGGSISPIEASKSLDGAERNAESEAKITD
jgi:hypothetical protein